VTTGAAASGRLFGAQKAPLLGRSSLYWVILIKSESEAERSLKSSSLHVDKLNSAFSAQEANISANPTDYLHHLFSQLFRHNLGLIALRLALRQGYPYGTSRSA